MSGDGTVVGRGVIEVEVNDAGVDAGISKIERTVKNLGATAAAAGKQASDGISKIGDGGDKVASNIDRTTKQIASSIQRTTAALEAGTKGSTAYYASLANARGANLDVLKPLLGNLEQITNQTKLAAEANQRFADSQKFLANLSNQTTGIGKTASELAALRAAELGVTEAAAPMIAKLRETEEAAKRGGASYGQTAFALRSLPAQFTDIAVSLEGGQKPLTVLLQQGGQLKDLFGGIGPAARALSGYILGLINPYTLAAAAVAGLATAYYAGSEESTRLQNALILTGNYAGKSAEKLTALATEVGKSSGSYSLAREGIEALANSGTISGDKLQVALRGIVAGAELTGKPIKDLVTDFESIAKDPVKALLTLNEKYNFLTVDIYKNVKALEDQGKTQDAATLGFKAFSDTLQGRREQIKTNLGYIESAWDHIKKSISGAKDSLLEFGRVDTDQQKLKGIEDRLNTKGGRFGVSSDERDRLQQEAEKLRDKIQSDAIQAEQDSKTAIAKKNKVDQQQELDKYTDTASRLSSAGKVAKEISDENKAFALAIVGFDKNSEDYKKALNVHHSAIANINEKANKAAVAEKKRQEDAYKKLVSDIEQKDQENSLEVSSTTKLTDSQKIRIKLNEDLAQGTIKLTDAQKTNIDFILYSLSVSEKDLAQKQKDIELKKLLEAAEVDYQKTLEETQAAQQKYFDDIEKTTQTLIDKADAQERENSLIGKTAEELSIIATARYDERIAMLETEAAYLKSQADRDYEIEQIEKQIDALTRLRNAESAAPIIKKQAEDTKKQLEEAKKSAEDLNKSITDALFRGFESGKSFAKNFRDTLVNSFKTLVLRPIVSFLVSPLSNALSGSFGGLLSSANANAGGIGGTGAAASSASILDLGKTIFNGISNFQGSVTSSITKLGDFIKNGQGGALDSIGGFLGTNAGTIGNVLPYAGAVIQALTGDIKGAAFTAAGAALGSVIPGVGTVLGATIGSIVGSFFGGAKTKGDTVKSTYSNGVFSNRFTGSEEGGGSLGAVSSLQALNQQFTSVLGGFLTALGDTSTINVTAMYKAKKDAQGALFGDIGGTGFGAGFKNYGSGSDAFTNFVNNSLGPALVSAIQASKLPVNIKGLFDGLTDKTQITNMIGATETLQSAQKELADRFGLTVDESAKVSISTGLANDQLVAFIGNLATTAVSLKTQGKALIETRDTLEKTLGQGLPTSIDAFDQLLKSIDASTADGAKKFADLFAVRSGYAQYQSTIDSLRANVKTSVFSISSPAAQAEQMQTDLQKVFGQLNLSIPGSVDELISLGQSIDYTTEAGLNLASAFPTLVTAFTQTKDAANALIDSLISKAKFASLVDYQRYQGVASNYGAQFASDYVANLSAGRIVYNQQGQAQTLTSNPDVVDAIKSLRSDLNAALVAVATNTQQTALVLKRWNGDGMPEVRVIA